MAAKQPTWTEIRKKKYSPKPMTPMTNGAMNEIKTYFLSEEELAYYRSLKPPIPDREVRTLAYQDRRHVNLRSEG